VFGLLESITGMAISRDQLSGRVQVMFRNPVLSASLAMSALVSTVMMATLVVGPFYLSRALGLQAALVGFVLSVGPLVAALTVVRAMDATRMPRPRCVGLIETCEGILDLIKHDSDLADEIRNRYLRDDDGNRVDSDGNRLDEDGKIIPETEDE
jgi:hypothetical protein